MCSWEATSLGEAALQCSWCELAAPPVRRPARRVAPAASAAVAVVVAVAVAAGAEVSSLTVRWPSRGAVPVAATAASVPAALPSMACTAGRCRAAVHASWVARTRTATRIALAR